MRQRATHCRAKNKIPERDVLVHLTFRIPVKHAKIWEQ